jgi:ribosomal protein S18 acetylase RimI-like enzyme
MEIVRLRDDQLTEASQVLARAFLADPAWLWLIPDERRRAAVLPWLFRVGFEIAAGDVWTTDGAVLGCARWLPPGRQPMRVGAALRAFVATPLRLREATSRFFAYGRALETMRIEAANGAHWYLAGLGVEPAQQRQGIGSALLQPGIEGSTREGLPCVLLTNDEKNLSFYEHHGFETVLEGEKPPGGPYAWAMVRKPR